MLDAIIVDLNVLLIAVSQVAVASWRISHAVVLRSIILQRCSPAKMYGTKILKIVATKFHKNSLDKGSTGSPFLPPLGLWMGEGSSKLADQGYDRRVHKSWAAVAFPGK